MRELPRGGFTGSFLVSVEAPSCLRDGCIQFRVFSENKTTLHLGYSSSRVFVNQKPVGLRGLRLVTGSSLSSVAFRPAGIVGFHTVTESWFLPNWRSSEDFRGRDRSLRQSMSAGSVSADVPCPLTLALSEKSPYLGGAWVRRHLRCHRSSSSCGRQSSSSCGRQATTLFPTANSDEPSYSSIVAILGVLLAIQARTGSQRIDIYREPYSSLTSVRI
jgi:hypothetical protein